MEVVKKGSKGEAVKTLQKALGITADGVFGAGTEKALMAWQKEHGLTADGICGNATWKALGVTEESKCVDSSAKYIPLIQCCTPKANRAITYLAIHFTAGSRSTSGCATNVKNVFLQNLQKKQKSSADFAVDDETIVQFNPDLKNYYCWAVGGKYVGTGGGTLYGKATNSNTISIEICSSLKNGYSPNHANTDGWYFTDKALENARKLCRILMAKYNIPLERVVRHYDISGKMCPGIRGWNNGKCYSNDGKITGEQNNSHEWLMFKASL